VLLGSDFPYPLVIGYRFIVRQIYNPYYESQRKNTEKLDGRRYRLVLRRLTETRKKRQRGESGATNGDKDKKNREHPA
jgi:hypothetical protein